MFQNYFQKTLKKSFVKNFVCNFISRFLKILSGHLSPSKGTISFSKNGSEIEKDLVSGQFQTISN